VDTEEIADLAPRVAPYIALMTGLADGAISTEEFSTSYKSSYLADSTDWPEELFDVLDEVFATADNVVTDAGRRNKIAFAVAPEDLRVVVLRAIASLKQMLERAT
jgi:hypothetical protein